MSGVAVVLAKLHAYSALTAVVPVARIVAGDLIEETQLPAISVTQISSVPKLTVKLSVSEFTTDRVQVTVLAKKYPQLREVLRLVRLACPHTRGTVAGIKVDSILPGVEGPDDVDEQIKFYGGSRDFIVNWTS